MGWKGKGICILLSLLAAALLTGAVLRGEQTGEKVEETAFMFWQTATAGRTRN